MMKRAIGIAIFGQFFLIAAFFAQPVMTSSYLLGLEDEPRTFWAVLYGYYASIALASKGSWAVFLFVLFKLQGREESPCESASGG